MALPCHALAAGFARARVWLFDFAPHTGWATTWDAAAGLLAEQHVEWRRMDREAEESDSELFVRWMNDVSALSAGAAVIHSSPATHVVAGAWIRQLAAQREGVRIIAALDTEGLEETLACLRDGVDDFVTPPARGTELVARLLRWFPLDEIPSDAIRELKERLGLCMLVGQSPAFVSVLRQIPVIARHDSTVFIAGETGTGKEVCARAIHYLSPRSTKPFVPVNCGALPLDLLENELFGHEAGAFTGAGGRRQGLISEAEGGTLFLDEIDALPMLAQVKVLRFLQAKEYRPLGSRSVCHGDVRIIAASNTRVREAVASGRLRSDLFYRLNVLPLHLPPLRQRREDILSLVDHFVAKLAAQFRRPIPQLTVPARQKLLDYDWPGNVRELENVIERAIVLAEGPVIDTGLLWLGPDEPEASTQGSFRECKAQVVRDFELTYLRQLLGLHNWNVTRAAHAAGKNRRAFWELMRKHHIQAPLPERGTGQEDPTAGPRPRV